MDDVTETVFRQIVAATASPDLFYTEFTNVDGLMSAGRPALLRKLRMAVTETHLIAQLWGLQPANFKAVAEQIADGSLAQELGLPEGHNFVGVDLNMGCPAKSEVQNGACSALIKNRPLASEIIKATQAGLAGRLPLSVKTRVGFNEVDLTWVSFLLGHDLQMLTVHGRTRKQMSKVPANWDLIGQACELRDELGVKTLIVGNGDVENHAHGLALVERYKLDGIMIGRGIFQDPFVFAETSPWQNYSRQQRIELYKKHVQLFAETWGDRQRNIKTLNRFCKVYISGFDGAKELRETLMNASSTAELLELLASPPVKNAAAAQPA
jgi:tRNA-dihydrouridine synthase